MADLATINADIDALDSENNTQAAKIAEAMSLLNTKAAGGGSGAEWKTQAYDFSADYAANVELELPSDHISVAFLHFIGCRHDAAGGSAVSTLRVYANFPSAQNSNRNFYSYTILNGLTNNANKNAFIAWVNSGTGVSGSTVVFGGSFSNTPTMYYNNYPPGDYGQADDRKFASAPQRLCLLTDHGDGITGKAYLIYKESVS